MSIRLIAQELYRLYREIETLEEKITRAAYRDQVQLKDQLRKVRAEYQRMRKIMDGQKEKRNDPEPARRTV
jgi:hypothetical protein